MLIIFIIVILSLNTITTANTVNNNKKYPEYVKDNLISDENNINYIYPYSDNINNNYDSEKYYFYDKNEYGNDIVTTNKKNYQKPNSDNENLYFNSDNNDCAPHCYRKEKFSKSFDKDKLKILMWTIKQLELLHNLNESIFSDVNNLNQNNLSGRRELPLYVEEPKFVVIRREEEEFDRNMADYMDDPFIPPRGRKHIPELQKLLERYDLFVPNRGKKDKIKDIFKYDDLFFPNRGKKLNNKIIKKLLFKNTIYK